jgi:hypothetical protein
MPDEIRTTTDAALDTQNDKAAQNVETPSVEPKPEEPQPVIDLEAERQKEQSRLGRKVAAIERELTAKLNKLDTIEASLERLQTSLQSKNTEEDDEVFIQKKELPTFLERERQKTQLSEQKKQQQFLDGLIATSLQEGDTEEEFEQVKKEIADNYNVNITGDPKAFGELLYNKAKKSILKKELAEQRAGAKTPLKHEKPKAPLGGGQANVIPTQKKSIPKLDPGVADFARAMGLNVQDIEKALAE